MTLVHKVKCENKYLLISLFNAVSIENVSIENYENLFD